MPQRIASLSGYRVQDRDAAGSCWQAVLRGILVLQVAGALFIVLRVDAIPHRLTGHHRARQDPHDGIERWVWYERAGPSAFVWSGMT